MQVTEKPKTVCVKCKWFKPSEVELEGKAIIAASSRCVAAEPTIVSYDTVTGNPREKTPSPQEKNDGNCKDYEVK